MPLQDHFHAPLSLRRHWTAFHASWATYLSAQLNCRLPEGFFAQANIKFGIELDVATFAETGGEPDMPAEADGGWAPPAPALTLPCAALTDVVEVQVFNGSGGPTLVGVVELISPSNKDRPAEGEAFVSKCAAYLQQGVGLVIVDVVTERRANLHGALLARLATEPATALKADLYAASYHLVQHEGQTTLNAWEALAVGSPLPTMPLWLRGGMCLPVELEVTYERTCQEQRIRANGA
jgi:hypothetical protein